MDSMALAYSSDLEHKEVTSLIKEGWRSGSTVHYVALGDSRRE